jgi:glutamate/aspartate transport system ATP-binding protein
MDKGLIVEDCTKDEFFGSPRSSRACDFLAKIIH